MQKQITALVSTVAHPSATVGNMQQRLKHSSRPRPMAIIIGAGASRGVSYANEMEIPSPLDADFFDLLQRIAAKLKGEKAAHRVLRDVQELSKDCWYSFERAFYTVHLRTLIEDKLKEDSGSNVGDVVGRFTRCFQDVLRQAHGKNSCLNHKFFFEELHEDDRIISFNYDLVADRALAELAAKRSVDYGPWIYGLSKPGPNPDLPILLKLHGSSNWKINDEGQIESRIENWSDFDDQPQYRAASADFNDPKRYPLLLPFWDKPVERRPWLQLWKEACKHLARSEDVIVWGYSLPATDIKATHLFSMSLGSSQFGDQTREATGVRLCVIDPSLETRRRWRETLPDAQFWQYSSLEDFKKHPPLWWTERGDDPDEE